MTCSVCGDICRCSVEEVAPASPRSDSIHVSSESPAPQEATASLEPGPTLVEEASTSSVSAQVAPEEDSTAWRQEVAARLNRYQARRKPRPPRYPSLRLRFEVEEQPRTTVTPLDDFSATPIMPVFSNQALALDRTVEEFPSEAFSVSQMVPGTDEFVEQAPPQTAKIIEFPRSWTPAPPPPDQLAEPVITQPRILEAPELAPPPPALGGITIEAPQKPDLEKRPGIDIPLQNAPFARRLLAAFVDNFIIAVACALFGLVFWKLTAIRPPRIQMAAFFAGLAGLFWAAYQYLLVVYAGSTPGLRLAHLELTRFDGSRANRRLRRWRVLASFLSAASLGMGYAWVFLDEDSLCWHDRITHTHLAPKGQTAAPKNPAY